MTYLPSLPAGSTLLDVFRAFPAASRPLLDFHEAVMRGPSPLTVAERELIAAYVSGLNACDYCHGVHTETAASFGVPADLLEALVADPDAVPDAALDAAGSRAGLRSLLRYVAAVTREPARVTPGDAAAVLADGWDEQALHDAVAVCGLFNLMNRLVDGLGVEAGADYRTMSGRRLAEGGYAALKDLL